MDRRNVENVKGQKEPCRKSFLSHRFVLLPCDGRRNGFPTDGQVLSQFSPIPPSSCCPILSYSIKEDGRIIVDVFPNYILKK